MIHFKSFPGKFFPGIWKGNVNKRFHPFLYGLAF